MNKIQQRSYEWDNLIEDFDAFFYSDNGIYTCCLMDNNLKNYNFNYKYIEKLIRRLKDYENKYDGFYKDEQEVLERYKEELLELDTGTNGINNFYEMMRNMYLNMEDTEE